MSIREKHTDKMEEILEKEMYADEGFSEIDEEDQRPETQKVMKQERRQQRKNRRKKQLKPERQQKKWKALLQSAWSIR